MGILPTWMLGMSDWQVTQFLGSHTILRKTRNNKRRQVYPLVLPDQQPKVVCRATTTMKHISKDLYLAAKILTEMRDN